MTVAELIETLKTFPQDLTVRQSYDCLVSGPPIVVVSAVHAAAPSERSNSREWFCDGDGCSLCKEGDVPTPVVVV